MKKRMQRGCYLEQLLRRRLLDEKAAPQIEKAIAEQDFFHLKPKQDWD